METCFVLCELGIKIVCEYMYNAAGSQFSKFVRRKCSVDAQVSHCTACFQCSDAPSTPPPLHSPPTYTILTSNFLAKCNLLALSKFRRIAVVQLQHLKSEPDVQTLLLLHWLRATYIHLLIFISL